MTLDMHWTEDGQIEGQSMNWMKNKGVVVVLVLVLVVVVYIYMF